jgi:hypothetical protein
VLSSTVVQPDAPASFNPPPSFRDQCPIGWKGVHFDASSLTRDDHHAVVDDVTDVPSYLAALQARIRAKP